MNSMPGDVGQPVPVPGVDGPAASDAAVQPEQLGPTQGGQQVAQAGS